MKKILFPIAAIAFSLAACDSTPKFTINGTVEGEQTGNAYLIKTVGKTVDTLAKAPIADGKFVLTGHVPNTTQAYIGLEGKKTSFQVILENANYTADLNLTSPLSSKVEGTLNQQVVNDFTTTNNNTRAAQSEAYKQYSAAAQTKDTATMRLMREKYENLGKAAEAKHDSLVKANPDTYAAAYIIASKMNGMDTKELNKQFAQLGPNAQASEAGQKITKRMNLLAAIEIGKVAPDFTLNTPDGKPLSMHSIKGKVKIIDFWASWCGPCRRENPNVVKIYEEYHPKGLEILGVSLDNNKEAWVKAIEDDKLTWNHVSDLKGWSNEAAQLYAVNGIPHMIVLDENNVIVAKDLRGDALKQKVAEMLK